MWVGILPLSVYVYHMNAVPKEVIVSSGTDVKDGCEWSCGYWESNSGLLQDA